jgi:hypothetical protein
MSQESPQKQYCPEDWVWLAEIARVLGVGTRTVTRYRTKGYFPPSMVMELPSGLHKYHRPLIKAWLIPKAPSQH